MPHELSRACVHDHQLREGIEVVGVHVGPIGVSPSVRLERREAPGVGETETRGVDLLLGSLLPQDQPPALAVDEHSFPAAKDRPDPTTPKARASERHATHTVSGAGLVRVKMPVGGGRVSS